METRQKQQACELRFIVYNRALHPELFEIHHDHRIVKARFEAQIWVTGLSHVIGFYRDDAAFCEVVADAATELPRRGRLVSLPFRGEKDQQCKQFDAQCLEYESAVDV